MNARRFSALALATMLTATTAHAWTPVLAPRDWSFPRDHGAHPDFRTEWWYWTGHLESEGHRYGYEIVFFRRGMGETDSLPAADRSFRPPDLVPAHVALTDVTGNSFRHEQRLRRTLGGVAGFDSTDLDVWCGDWRAGRTGEEMDLTVSAGEFALDLVLTPEKPPVLHGAGGISRKGAEEEEASYYCSLTRLTTRGTLTRRGEAESVTGLSWMDHEFFSRDLDATLAGWDWFSIQLDDRTELMLYRLRAKGGNGGDRLSGTFVRDDATTLPLAASDITLEQDAAWTSPKSGITWPAGWTIRLPRLDLTLTLAPEIADQELDTRGSTGVVYWEGSVSVRGTRNGSAVRGVGYAELTGYDGNVPMRDGSTRP